MARRPKNFADIRHLRRMIGGGLAVAVLAVVAVGLFYVFRPVGEATEGTHYALLPGSEEPRRGEVVVTEYFSYGCVHCRRFDPQLERWQEDLPEGARFERIPVVFSPRWRPLAAAYYAAEELDVLERNHDRLFSAIHDAGVDLTSQQALVQFFAGHGVDGETFRRAMSSPSVQRKIEAAMAKVRENRIRGVPTLVVDDRYLISAGELSRAQMLDVADRLVERELEARQAG